MKIFFKIFNFRALLPYFVMLWFNIYNTLNNHYEV